MRTYTKLNSFLLAIVVTLSLTLQSVQLVQASPVISNNVPATTWYVATTGSDANDCATPSTPCLTINFAINQAGSGDTIKIAQGIYNPSVGSSYIVDANTSLILLGGWNSDFSLQTGFTTLVGGGVSAQGLSTDSLSLNRFIIRDVTINYPIYSVVNLSVTNSSINHNMQRGVSNFGPSLIMNNVTISNNISDGSEGGGIFTGKANVTLNNVTISDNYAYAGGGIYYSPYYGTGTLSLHAANTIISGNTSATVSPNCNGPFMSDGHNIIGDTSGCIITSASGDQLNVDPLLGVFLSEEGYHPLTQSSPAIDAGAGCFGATDQRDAPRVGACDIGAYEYITPGAAAFLGYFDGSNQLAGIGMAFSNPLTVYVLDIVGSPVPDVTVTFTAPFSGASGTFANSLAEITSAVSNSNGITSSSVFTANNHVGTYNVTASISGLGGSVTFALTNLSAYYVATTGNDFNSCTASDIPCLTINGAIGKATGGNVIKVATGFYTGSDNEVVLIDKSITLSGGWDTSFNTQSGISIIDGQGARRGITTTGAPVTVDHFTIQNGFHGFKGGGIYNNGTLTLNDSIVSSNVSSWMGGGIYNNNTLTINDTSVSGNNAGGGGSGGGGGAGIQNDGILTLNNSTVSGNMLHGSFDGSGISNFATLTLNNSTVSGNTGGDGNGIYVLIGTVVLNNSTLSNNQLRGIENQGGHVNLQNTIMAGNGSWGDCYNDTGYGGTVTSQGYNLIGNGNGCTLAPTTGDQVGTTTSPINPGLTPLQDNGGPALTHALIAGSPANNAGNPAVPGSGGTACLATDQRGITRPVGRACDIGSFEYSGPTFADVPVSHWANNFIERLYNNGITGGCSTNLLMYCPETNINRAQMAVFLLRGEHGSAYVPPAVGSGTGFTDVPSDYWAAAWIKQLALEGITSGCGPSLYCPETSVTRDQMAVFLLRAEHGASYTPPPATGVFTDVPTDHWAAPWIEQLAAEGITGGCGTDTYCPSTPVTRAQMAVFLVRAFNLP